MNPYKHDDDFVLITQEKAKKNFLEKIQNNRLLKNLFNNYQDDLLSVNEELGLSKKISLIDIKEINYLISKYKITDSNHLSSINKMIEDVDKIKNALMPLSKIGIEFEVSLVGGAIRDLLLGQSDKIKDLDILVSINDGQFKKYLEELEKPAKGDFNNWDLVRVLSHEELYEQLFENYELATKDRYKKLDIKEFKNDESSNIKKIEQFFYHVLKEVVSKKFNIEKEFPPTDVIKLDQSIENIRHVEVEDYINMLLRGVLKLNDKTLNYNVDILLTNIETKKYVEFFDFNICQTYLPIYNNVLYNNLNEEYSLKPTIEDFKNNIIANEAFLIDMLKRKLTLNPTGFISIDKIHNTVNSHYPRIKEKYPEYEFNLDDNVLKNKDVNMFDLKEEDFELDYLDKERVDFLLTFISYLKINSNLESKKLSKEKKNKI